MSQHVSLRVQSVGIKHRNVLKKLERVKKLQNDNKWNDRASVYNLPKVKSMKIKVKKSSGPSSSSPEGSKESGGSKG